LKLSFLFAMCFGSVLLTSCFGALQKEKEASQDLEVVSAEVANLKEAVKSAEVIFCSYIS
jgi:outer membrane murein-binding lipoprotein Lpp